jgi:peptidoglycan/LPS O-acetylase OafA/YrhL
MKLSYHSNLDGLRGIAAIMVVVFHFYSYPNGYYSGEFFYRKFTDIGQHGVSLFFVLSGFVITRILIHSKNERYFFSSFFIRRILRIAPLYYLFLFVWFYVLPFIIHYPVAPVAKQLPYYFYLQNIFSTWRIPLDGPPHFWSLAVEEHFYLLWPIVVYYTPIKNLGRVIIAAVLFSFAVKYVMISQQLSIHDFTLTRIDQILLGGSLALLERRGFFKAQSLGSFVVIAPMIFSASIIIFVLGDQFPFVKEIFKYFLLGVSFASLLVIILSLRQDSMINRFLTSPLLQYLGKISYGLYVWHVIPLILMQNFFVTGLMALDMAFVTVLTVMMAHFSYFYFEMVFIRMKDTIPPRLCRSISRAFKSIYQRFLLNCAVILKNTTRL